MPCIIFAKYMRNSALLPKNGFTLIEMSIVLVIIGLIVGGVLVGRDLLKVAEIRNTVKQFEEFNTAVNTFKSKYNCLPGDCVDAGGTNGFGFDPGANGNGNGTIGLPASADFNDSSFIGANIKEHLNFWYHLSAASLIHYHFAPATSAWADFFPTAAGGTTTPPTKVLSRRGLTIYGGQGGWFVQPDLRFDSSGNFAIIDQHVFLLASVVPFGFSPGVPLTLWGSYMPSDIQAIDQKIDDGLPLSGSARAWSGFSVGNTQIIYSITTGAGGPADPVCVQGSGNSFLYNVQYGGDSFNGLCSLALKATF